MIESPASCYFAASNSSGGFRSYYGEIFADDRVDHLYIIKGGPGTGKSHFMKAVARHGRGRGYCVTEYACSSDPASLDGLILSKEGTPTLGFLDGTPPHPREPAFPGVREELVNLGAFWNSRQLIEQGETIRRLSEGKSAAYRRAYAYLSACGAVDSAAESRVEDCIREDRIRALVERILRGQPKGGRDCKLLPALRRAVGMTGEVCLHTFEQEAVRSGGAVLALEDHYGVAYRVTRTLFERSRAVGHEVYVSYDPIHPHKIDGLYYPDGGLCILVGDVDTAAVTEAGIPLRSIPLRRFLHAEPFREIRGDLRRACAECNRLTEAALEELSSAAKFHFELEGIYSEAMNFKAKEAFTEQFCNDLFAE